MDRVIDEFNLLRKIIFDASNIEQDRLLFQLKIRDLGVASVNELSEGQKQMVALACMFLRNPAIVFLDEPLTMLDSENRDLFLGWLREFKTTCNSKGLVITTHRPEAFSLLNPTYFVFEREKRSFVRKPAFTDRDVKQEYEDTIPKVSPYYLSPNPAARKPLITMDRATIWYRKNVPLRGLSNLNFSFKEYQHVLLTGTNGTGKTTIGKTLCGIHRTYEGKIEICGKDLRDINPIKAGYIKMVVQIPAQQLIFRTVREDICYSVKHLDQSHINGLLDEIATFLKSFDISFDDDPHSLSFGQQKIVCLLSHLDFPNILFIDEPSMSMDQSQQDTVLDIIRFYQQQGVTTVISTHEPGVFRRVSVTEITLEK